MRPKSLVQETERLRRQLGYQGVLEDLVGTSAQMHASFSRRFSRRRPVPLPWSSPQRAGPEKNWRLRAA